MDTNRSRGVVVPKVFSLYGDWCDGCADDAAVHDPVRFPVSIDEDGKATYRCRRCGHAWTCWWAVEERAA